MAIQELVGPVLRASPTQTLKTDTANVRGHLWDVSADKIGDGVIQCYPTGEAAHVHVTVEKREGRSVRGYVVVFGWLNGDSRAHESNTERISNTNP